MKDIAGQLASLKGEAHASLRDPNYDALKLRLEATHFAVEAAAVGARRRVRLNENRGSREKAGVPKTHAGVGKDRDPF